MWLNGYYYLMGVQVQTLVNKLKNNGSTSTNTSTQIKSEYKYQVHEVKIIQVGVPGQVNEFQIMGVGVQVHENCTQVVLE